MTARPSGGVSSGAREVVAAHGLPVASRLSSTEIAQHLGVSVPSGESVRMLVLGMAVASGLPVRCVASRVDAARRVFGELGAIAARCTETDVARIIGCGRSTSVAVARMVRGMTMVEAPQPVAPTQRRNIAPAREDARRVLMVVGDAHAAPGQSLARFAWLGRLTAEVRPSHVLQVGDFFDLPSLSHYDKGRLSGEGRRFADDYRAGEVALQTWHREAQGALDEAERLFTEGNHEERGARYINDAPELVGVLSDPCSVFSQYGWRVARFLEVGRVAGFACSHYWHPKGNTKSSIGGTVYPARAIRLQLHEDAISGHSHGLSWERHVSATGRAVHTLVSGCYDDASHGWARRDNDRYAIGVSVLREYDGGWTHEWLPIERIAATYGHPGDDSIRVG